MRSRPLVCSMARLEPFGDQQPEGRAAWVAGRTLRVRLEMHRVHEQDGLVVRQRIQQIVVGFDEGCLLFLVQLARDCLRLAVFEAKPVQKPDDARASVIGNIELGPDGGADLAGRAWQRLLHPCGQTRLLRIVEQAGAAPGVKADDAFQALRRKQPVPLPDGVVVDMEHFGDVLAARPVVQQNQRIGPSRQPMRRRPVASQRDQVPAVGCR